MIFLAVSFALVIGIAGGWTAATIKFRKTAALRRDLGFLTRRVVDLEPSEFGTFWEARQ